MKCFKKIILTVLATGLANSPVFAMRSPNSSNSGSGGDVGFLSILPNEILLSHIFPSLTKQHNLKTAAGICDAVQSLLNIRATCKKFNNLLTTEEIRKILKIAKSDYLTVLEKPSRNALILAAKNGDTKRTRLLLLAGVNLFAKDSGGQIAVTHALFNGHAQVAQILLAAMPEAKMLEIITAVDENGCIPLHIVAAFGFHEVIKFIDALPKTHQATQITTRDLSGLTALHHAVRNDMCNDRNVVKKVAQVLINYYKKLGIEIPYDLLPELGNLDVNVD